MGWHARAAPGKLQGNLEEAWGKLQGGLEESSAFDRAQPSTELSPGQSSTLDRAQPKTELNPSVALHVRGVIMTIIG